MRSSYLNSSEVGILDPPNDTQQRTGIFSVDEPIHGTAHDAEVGWPHQASMCPHRADLCWERCGLHCSVHGEYNGANEDSHLADPGHATILMHKQVRPNG